MGPSRGSRNAKRPASGSRGGSPAKKSPPKKSPAKKSPQAAAPPPHPPAGPFRLGAVAGTTPGRWIDTWKERMPRTPLELVPLEPAAQREALQAAAVDAALVRLPIDRDGLHLIPLYDEVPVVVCAADSHLTAAEQLTLDDLAGEVVITPRDSVLDVQVPGAVAPSFAPPATTGEAIATVAAGVGVVIVPMSLARLHHRKDADYRPLREGPVSSVALAWPKDAEGDAAEMIETFVGIVRGRTAHSSRS